MENVDDNLNLDGRSARYGNFTNYYEFHPTEFRIKLIPNNVWDLGGNDIVCLDVGCNSGKLAQALHQHISSTIAFTFKNKKDVPKCYILGVDVSQELIDKAVETNNNPYITFKTVDVCSKSGKNVINQYLSCFNRTSFDIVFCFSVTMWIHLNYGDEALKEFLLYVSNQTDMLVLEPQPWRCYLRAVRRLKRAENGTFEKFSKLKMRLSIEDDIENILIEECKFNQVLKTEETPWGRIITFYKRKKKHKQINKINPMRVDHC
uniref:RNA methyltransferase n=1 Tax=Clastoptera arizonana TaxID=38151 RepID=A0A1B6CG44_9HEMI